MDQTKNRISPDWRISLLCVCVGCWLADATALAQPQRIQVINGFGGLAQPAAMGGESPQTVDPELGAVLKTDPDLEVSLETAERFRNDGNYRIAAQLWQAVLQRSGDALYSKDGITYFSLVQQVEQILSNLPPEGLAAYRVTADAEAKEILAEANDPNDITALNRIVRQYFVSSLGDDAAFRLGCIYLDRFDFIGARRMFEKIVNHYPDPSVEMDQVILRIALCQSYLGEIEAAKQSLEQARKLAGQTDKASMVSQTLGKLVRQNANSIVSSEWHMPLGNARRFGVMPGPPDDIMNADLVSVWQYYFEPGDSYNWSDAQGRLLITDQQEIAAVATTMTATEEKLVSNWKQDQWRPAGHLLFDDHRVYFKSAADLTAWDVQKIDRLIANQPAETEFQDAISWRSIWRNAFEVDAATKMIQTIRNSWGGSRNSTASSSGSPNSVAEVQLFGDRIQQQMSIHHGVLYSLEGKRFNERNPHKPRTISPQWNTSFRRTRSNFLTAYDAATGEVLWTLPRNSDDTSEEAETVNETETSPWLEGGGFMSAPVGFGNLILIPVNSGGSISIYALDPAKEGQTIWKSFLCDEPESGAESWSPIDLTLDGSDLFVNCGMGVVFVLDPATGMVRFAKRYERVGTADEFRRRSGWTVNRLNFDGWSNDIIIPYGRQMICFSSDSQTIEAFDRNDGKMIWKSDLTPIGYKVDYLLGIYDGILYAAGRETIVAYELKGEGRMVWGAEQMFDGKSSMGRGLLTPKGIYMPVENSIYHFSLPGGDQNGKLLARVEVNFGTEAPVGNLYSDGKRFWVHGANRLYALAPKSK